jgi:hypothetical protein
LLVLPVEKPFDCAGKPGPFFVGAEGFRQAVDFNDGHQMSFKFQVFSFKFLFD